MSESKGLSPVIHAIAWRVNLAVWLNRALGWCGAVLAATAVGVLLCKMLWPGSAPLALAILALLPLAGLQGWRECRRRGLFFTPAEVVEVIDHRYRDDGAVATAWENAALLPPERLYDTVANEVRERLPKIDFGYYLKKAAPALLLLAAAVAAPSRQVAPLPQSDAILASMAQPLADKLAQNEQILPEETLKELKEELKTLQQDEKGISKEKWEATEELQQRIDSAVEQSQQNVSATMASLNKLSDMMDSSGNISGKGVEAQQQELLKDLEKAMKDAKTPLPQAMRREIAEMARQMQQGGSKSSQEMRQKLESLKKGLSQCPGGNCDGPGQVGRGAGQANKDGKGNGPDGDGGPDSGGVNRGRGDAQLTLGNEKNADGAQFKDQELQSQVLSPEDMVDMGITPLQPKAEPGKFSPGTLRQFQAQQGNEVSRTRISPSQKDVIGKYFSEK